MVAAQQWWAVRLLALAEAKQQRSGINGRDNDNDKNEGDGGSGEGGGSAVEAEAPRSYYNFLSSFEGMLAYL